MVSPWTIYWVLQLDSIGVAAVMMTVILGVLLFFLWGMYLDEDGPLETAIPALLLTPVWALVFAAAIFLPSTKTAAAMIVVPAIANNPAIQHEAGDLYALAKDALKQAIAPDHKQRKDD